VASRRKEASCSLFITDISAADENSNSVVIPRVVSVVFVVSVVCLNCCLAVDVRFEGNRCFVAAVDVVATAVAAVDVVDIAGEAR